MGRYIYQTTDKAEKLEEYVKNIAEETNKFLKGAELREVTLSIRNPFHLKGKDFFNGFVSMHIKFSFEEPSFLTESDEGLFYSKIRELKRERFGFDAPAGGLEFLSINFEEPTEEELYILTPRKEATLKDGFDRVKKYAEMFCSAVESYPKVIKTHSKEMGKYLSGLESLSRGN